MNAPFDPEETHDGSAPEDPFDENSATWGAADPDFDRMLRERVGPLAPLSAPPYAFERVLLAGRRRRARKVWSVGAAAALVVMAGTAGTTVALHGASVGNGGTLPPAAQSSQTSAAPSPSASSASPSPAASTPSASPSTSASPTNSPTSTPSASVPPCHSDDLQLTVSLQPGSNNQDSLLIVLRNNSGHTCTTFGYPGLQTETVNEQLQSTTVTREDKSAVTTLTLAQGASVSTLAQFTTAPAAATASPGAGCGAPAYYLAVIPPDEKTQIVAPITGGPVTVCGNGALNTGPLADGTTG